MECMWPSLKREIKLKGQQLKQTFLKELKGQTLENYNKKTVELESSVFLFKSTTSFLKIGNMMQYPRFTMEKMLPILLIQIFGTSSTNLKDNSQKSQLWKD